MADAVISSVVERIIGLAEEQARFHINLVRGAEKEVHSLPIELRNIRNVLDDAENRRFKDKNINDWLVRLEQTSYQMEDILDEWNYAILKLKIENHHRSGDAAAPKQKVCFFLPSFSCLCFKKASLRHGIAMKILDVKAQLDEILKERNRYNFAISEPAATDPSSRSWRIQSTSLINLEKIHGRDRERDTLVTKLMGRGEELGILQVVSIVGVGGLGKTTLAQLVYNDSRVEKSFDLRIWVCVSDPFDEVWIARGILESVGVGSFSNITQLDVLLKHVKESISGKRFLLVLDDVWTEDHNKWEPLENSLRYGGAGSTILVTTRNERVAKIMGAMEDNIHRPGVLSDEDCWLLLYQVALSGRNTVVGFEEIGKKIAEKCKGLPLAAKTLGSLLRFKKTLEEWENVLNSEVWQLEQAEVELFPHLLLSYNELSPTLKRCFSYCAVFPKDYVFHVKNLIRFWMALGYLGSKGDMESRGRECFDILATRSLFLDFKRDVLDGKIIKCNMHDIVHEFAQFLRKSGRVEAMGMNKTTCGASDCSLLVSPHADEFCSLFWDARVAPPNLCHCVTRLRVLGLNKCGLTSLPQGIENLIHLRWLNLDRNTLSFEDLKIVFQLYNLQTLILSHCQLKKIPGEIGNLVHLKHINLSGNNSLKEVPMEIGNLIDLRHLNLGGNNSMKEVPREIGNLIHLRHLNLSRNNSLKELPQEIGNLIDLRHLNLRDNGSLKELPREIGNLIHLRHLNLSGNKSLKALPESICDLHELQTLNVALCECLFRVPEGLSQLSSLRTLKEFRGGSGRSKLALLKKLNDLGGDLHLFVRLANDGMAEVVGDAREAEMRNKIHIRRLSIVFKDELMEDSSSSSSSVRMDVIAALEPHPDLQWLSIEYYKGSKLDVSWLVSPFNQVREVRLYRCYRLSSLPPLGKLPSLEEVLIDGAEGLRFVGPEFLGISTRGTVVGFPKLKTMRFWRCRNWKEWEDITAEEEDSRDVWLMPCLTHLEFSKCYGLTALPHRLLHKASSLQVVTISYSTLLHQRYADENGTAWKSISPNNPSLELKMYN